MQLISHLFLNYSHLITSVCIIQFSLAIPIKQTVALKPQNIFKLN